LTTNIRVTAAGSDSSRGSGLRTRAAPKPVQLGSHERLPLGAPSASVQLRVASFNDFWKREVEKLDVKRN